MRTSKFDRDKRLCDSARRSAPWARSNAFRVLPFAFFCIPAYGHGFGLRYDLPLPLALWVTGAAATVLLSFLIVAVAIRSNAWIEGAVRSYSGPRPAGYAAAGRTMRVVAQLVAVAALILVVIAGIIGDQTPTRNLAPTAIWIAWWVGFSYVSAFVGNVWSVVNPWAAIFDWCEPFLANVRRTRVEWPARLGVWPAIGLFLIFAWIELVWEGRSIPSRLAALVIAYSILTWMGMFFFGRSTWLQHADPFAQAFGILSRFAPFGRRGLRRPGIGLLHTADVSASRVAFVVVMLSTVTFDGVMATPLWRRIEDTLYASLPALGDSRLALINTVGLLFFCAIFGAVYRLVATLIARASGNRMTPEEASGAFVLTLVPIAIAYLVAHYLSYFLIQGQLLIRLVSDPLGWGWNLFGTARFRPDIGIVGARFVWYTSLFAIVIGHVVAVSLAHIVALRRLDDSRVAVRSQVPMLVLMVAYTTMSLWIIAQPIVE